MKTNQKWKETINERLFFMNSTYDKLGDQIYPAQNSIKPVNFYFSAREAQAVHLAGGFNHWHPILMGRREDGWWFIQIWLPHGHHQYRFLVDDVPTLDHHAVGTACDEHGQPVSLIAVG